MFSAWWKTCFQVVFQILCVSILLLTVYFLIIIQKIYTCIWERIRIWQEPMLTSCKLSSFKGYNVCRLYQCPYFTFRWHLKKYPFVLSICDIRRDLCWVANFICLISILVKFYRNQLTMLTEDDDDDRDDGNTIECLFLSMTILILLISRQSKNVSTFSHYINNIMGM